MFNDSENTLVTSDWWHTHFIENYRLQSDL